MKHLKSLGLCLLVAFSATAVGSGEKLLKHATDSQSQSTNTLLKNKKANLAPNSIGDYGAPVIIEQPHSQAWRDPSILHHIGKGIDITRCGLYSYDSFEIQYDVFDRNFINREYALYGNFYQPTVGSTNHITYGSTVESFHQEFNLQRSTEAFAEASFSYFGAQLSAQAGFADASQIHSEETGMIYNAKSSTYLFDYELPSPAAMREEYINHLSADFIEDVHNAVTAANRGAGTYAYYALFEKYGTHILWKGSFGGACDLIYSAHTKEAKITNEVIESASATLGVVVPKVWAGLTFSFSMSSKVENQNAIIFERTRGRFFGGATGSVTLTTSFNETANVAKRWNNTVASNPVLLSYKKAEPIWGFLPSDVSYVASDIESAYYSYKDMQSDKYEGDLDNFGSLSDNLYDKYVYLDKSANQYLEFGDYWDVRRNQVFEVNLNNDFLYDVQKLKNFGYRKVKIEPTFVLKQLKSGTTVGIHVDFGRDYSKYSETNANIDITDGKEHTIHLSQLFMSMSIDDFISNRKLKFKFATNNRTWVVFGWQERSARLSDFTLKISYLR